jgi:hypothetical protein
VQRIASGNSFALSSPPQFPAVTPGLAQRRIFKGGTAEISAQALVARRERWGSQDHAFAAALSDPARSAARICSGSDQRMTKQIMRTIAQISDLHFSRHKSSGPSKNRLDSNHAAPAKKISTFSIGPAWVVATHHLPFVGRQQAGRCVANCGATAGAAVRPKSSISPERPLASPGSGRGSDPGRGRRRNDFRYHLVVWINDQQTIRQLDEKVVLSCRHLFLNVRRHRMRRH